MTNLYYIENEGCDDTTRGLVELTDREADVVVELFKNLNKNSTYGCMPEIHMYGIPEKLVSRPDGNEEREELLYTNTGEYVLVDNIFNCDYSTFPPTITFKEGVEKLV